MWSGAEPACLQALRLPERPTSQFPGEPDRHSFSLHVTRRRCLHAGSRTTCHLMCVRPGRIQLHDCNGHWSSLFRSARIQRADSLECAAANDIKLTEKVGSAIHGLASRDLTLLAGKLINVVQEGFPEVAARTRRWLGSRLGHGEEARAGDLGFELWRTLLTASPKRRNGRLTSPASDPLGPMAVYNRTWFPRGPSQRVQVLESHRACARSGGVACISYREPPRQKHVVFLLQIKFCHTFDMFASGLHLGLTLCGTRKTGEPCGPRV